jgi:hypothetical protein
MKLATIILAAGLASAITPHLLPPLPCKLTDPPVPCGPGLPPCSPDTICETDNYASCPGGSACPGTCAYINSYPFCGGETMHPNYCAQGERCVDDARFPESCGMACDAPGICVSEEQPRCTMGDGVCPWGLWCYRDLYTDCAGDGCSGVCL